MIQFRMIGHNIFYFGWIDDGFDPGKHFIHKRLFNGVDQGNLIRHHQISIVCAAARRGVAVKIPDGPIDRPNPVNMICHFNSRINIVHGPTS